ncbi:hypothetical protein Ancab_017818 [Ancistrocladus abbreviatus]
MEKNKERVRNQTDTSAKDSAEEETAPKSTDNIEGFESASEGYDDREPENDSEERQPEKEESEEVVVPQKDDPGEDPLNDDQLKERALALASDAKLDGNKLFKGGQYEDALSKYELSLKLTPEMPSSVDLRSICHTIPTVPYAT